jgi:3-oxoacyl-(acyl-carrier-protein) synthase
MRRVVITGVGVISALGNTPDEFSQALREGRSGLKYDPAREGLLRCRVTGAPDPLAVDQLSVLKFPKQHLRNMDEVIRYGCLAAINAWEDAGLSAAEEEPDWDSGVVFGSGGQCGINARIEVLPGLIQEKNIRKLGGSFAEKGMMEGIPSRVAAYLGLGQSLCLNNTSVTGLATITEGVRQIESGYAERMVCGGAETPSRYVAIGLDTAHATANSADPRVNRPLSRTAMGLVPAAGAGAVVVESLESAQQRGARIYAEVIGHHSNCGAQMGDGTTVAPGSTGIRRCIKKAMGEIDGSEVDLINGHLTGTMADPLEVKNLRAVLGDGMYLHATKSLLGHTLCACGAIETVACVLMMDGAFIHPSLNCEDLIPEAKGFLIPHKTVNKEVRTIVKCGFGFGDVNVVIVLRRWKS